MEGRVVFDGKNLARRPAHRIARAGIAYVPAERHLFPPMTSRRTSRLARIPRRPHHGALELVFDLFPRLAERHRQQAGTMSGGEQQMLAVGRALMARPELLMLDEPTTGLAPKARPGGVRGARRAQEATGMTLLIAEQQVPLALSLADRGYVLENGRIRLSGTSRRARRRTPKSDARTWASLERRSSSTGSCSGCAFGLLGVGMTLVYGLGGVLNLAHGQIAVLAAIVISLVMEDGVPTVLAAAVGVAGSRRRSPSCSTSR